VLALALLIWLGPMAGGAGGTAQTTQQARGPVLPCLNKKGTAYKAKFSPTRCAHFGPKGSFGRGVDLRDITWNNWGTTSLASGRGTECGFDANCGNTSVEVFAFRLRTVCGRQVYTRLRANSLNGSTVVKTRACLGRA
jgi:hypothetical protein